MSEFFASFTHFPHLGEALSASSGLTWAVAVILFRISGRSVHPLALNFFKNALASFLLLLTLLLLQEPLLPPAQWQDYALILLSGLLGIGLSDTLFFACLNLLGAALTAIIDCFYSAFVITLSFIFLGERMNGTQLLGALLIIAAVLIIVQKKPDQTISRRNLVLGIVLGILAMFFTAVGIVMIKPLLNRSAVLWVTLYRLVGGLVPLGLLIPFHPRRRAIFSPILLPKNWKYMFPGAIFGSYVGLMVWIAGMKHTQASIASALNQLSTIFIFILAAVFLKEKVTLSKLLAVFLAMLGALLVSVPLSVL